ncbi:hypothetical protein ACF9IK_31305 [Kitasatospora hibisci]|uniref:hypothetical protein n=1 Tax=Kitasatospora hibisci TaxID=3369522 RepID=UPI0037547389
MIPWPVDILLGVLLLVLETGAALRYVVNAAFDQWRRSKGGQPRSKEPGPALVVVPVVLPPALGAGLWWLGLPVSAGIQFAVPGVLVLLLAILAVIGAAKKRRDERDLEAAAGRDRSSDVPPPGSIVVPFRWDPDEQRYTATLEGFPCPPDE